MYVSIVSPVYKSKSSLRELSQQIETHLLERKVSQFEIIFVDDGCPENSWEEILSISLEKPFVKGLRLSRNFGQHFAISAGLQEAKGDYIIVMDCDLQENPKFIGQFIDMSKEGYDIVFSRKESRSHSSSKNITAYIYQKLMDLLTPPGVKPYDPAVGTFSLMTKKVRNEFIKISDCHRHYLMILRWLGFRSTAITISHEARKYGKSSYSFKKLFNHSIDGLVSQSTILLGYTAIVGIFLLGLSLLFSLYVTYRYFTTSLMPGWASLTISISLSTGLIIFCVGLSGLYIGKTFEQSRGRPLFIISEKTET